MGFEGVCADELAVNGVAGWTNKICTFDVESVYMRLTSISENIFRTFMYNDEMSDEM